jgi:hypothetical protein
MAGMIRPNKKAMEIAYRLLQTTKSLRQKNEKKPSEKRVKEWFKDSSSAS